ncbi:hypothetical protein MANES_11G165600v8 [Manihot esculenta]|uniref:Uncharacterized protein n=1 Tax=Manihot esculenta TaxID=3983 RepID=A0ACB7GY22_MANES|nr:hypothetical protein MANES_11G165600v8 [Manihot esculenta]
MSFVFVSTGCHAEHRCFYQKPSPVDIQSRKVLFVSKEGMYGASILSGKKLAIGDGELRTVPSGPDPLHHNGGTPKKPKTP